MTGPAREGTRCGTALFVGETNVGKSTLVNRLVRRLVSPVSPKPMTTIAPCSVIVTGEGYQCILLDCPGEFAKPRGLFERKIAAAALAGIDLADAVVLVVTPRFSERSRALARDVSAAGKPTIAVVNKVDIYSQERVADAVSSLSPLLPDARWMPVSATKRLGTLDLLEVLVSLLPPAPPAFDEDALTDRPARFLAAQAVRAAAMERLEDEVPHSVAVVVTKYDETASPVRIEADLFVERPSQVGIVVGKRGKTLASLSKGARLWLESLLGEPVFLRVTVKVRKNWRNDEPFVSKMF